MNINPKHIGRNIRKARLNRDITQSELAYMVNVSESAISQWESGKTSPDLGTIPKLCAILDISADWLLDVGSERREKEINDIIAQTDKLVAAAQFESATAILQEALNKYPTSDKLVYSLMLSIRNDDDKWIELGEWLLKNSTTDRFRHGAVMCLAVAYRNKGNRKKAEELAHEMPELCLCSESLLSIVLDGEKKNQILQEYSFKLLDAFNGSIIDCNHNSNKLAAEKSNALFELIFEKGDYGFFHIRLKDNYMNLAKHYASRKDAGKTLYNLLQATNHTLAFIEYVYNSDFKHSSFIFAGMHQVPALFNRKENTAVELLEELKLPEFGFIKETDEYNMIMSKLSSVADEWNAEKINR